MNLLTDRKSQEKNLKNSLLPKTTIKDPKKFAGSLLTPEAINEIKKQVKIIRLIYIKHIY